MSEKKPAIQMRFLVENFYDLQHLRIETFNRLVALAKTKLTDAEYAESIKQSKVEKPSDLADLWVNGKIKPSDDVGELLWYHNSLHETEKQLAKRLNAWSAVHPLRITYLGKIKGIGPILSSGLLAWIDPISRFDTVSKLWAYCGLSSEHWESQCKKGHKLLTTHALTLCPIKVGTKRTVCNAKMLSTVKVDKPIRRKRGFIICINPHLKTLMWKIAASFEKQDAKKSRYRKLYEEKKAYYANRADLKKAVDGKVKGAKLHIRLMTMRFTAKRFLSDLWVTWRRLENLSITEPYSVAMLKHTGYEPPETDSD